MPATRNTKQSLLARFLNSPEKRLCPHTSSGEFPSLWRIQREENEDPMPGKSHVGQSESNSALNYHCRFCHVMLRSPDFKGHLLLVAITLLFTSFSLPSSLPFPKGSPHSSSDSNIISTGWPSWNPHSI